jgi:hypothetical protein
MKLLRIGVANFRSIGTQPVVIDLQKRINLLIGANNSGKSGVLETLSRLHGEKNQFPSLILGDVDFHRRDLRRRVQLLFTVERTEPNEIPPSTRTYRFDVSGSNLNGWKLHSMVSTICSSARSWKHGAERVGIANRRMMICATR